MNPIGITFAVCVCLLFLVGSGSILLSIFMEKDNPPQPVKKPVTKAAKYTPEPIVSDEPPPVPTDELNKEDFDLEDYEFSDDLFDD